MRELFFKIAQLANIHLPENKLYYNHKRDVQMQQGNYTNITWNGTTNVFAAYLQGDTIFSANGEQVGVSVAKYKEVEEALLKCKNRLIELGEIKIPKTQEEIIAEQQQLLEQQSKAIAQLLEKVETYGKSTGDVEFHSAEISDKHKASTGQSSDDGRPVKGKQSSRPTKRGTKTGDTERSD